MKIDPLHHHVAATGTGGASSFALLTAMTVAELADAIPAGKLHGFYVAVGRRIAAAESLEGVVDVTALCWRVNTFWEQIGWGEAELALARDGIVVRHGGLPAPEGDLSGDHWRSMLLAVLEGVYDSWFRRLGSGPALTTRAEWKDETIELRHGR